MPASEKVTVEGGGGERKPSGWPTTTPMTMLTAQASAMTAMLDIAMNVMLAPADAK